MSKRLIILTDQIAPPAYAPRIVSLCRYLCEQGWECVVFSDREQDVPPFCTDYGTWYQTHYYTPGCSRWYYFQDKVFGAREKAFQRFIEQTVDVESFDAIFCSSCYFFPLQTTYRLSGKYRKPYFIDLRDISEQWGEISYRTQSPLPAKVLNRLLHYLFVSYNVRARNKVLAAANQVITISPWHQKLLSTFNANTELIYNGFDEKDFYPDNIPNDKFVISYAGKIYDLQFRDPRLLFEAMQQLLANGRMKREQIELRFHVDKASIVPLQELVEHYNLRDICHIGGYIPKSELLQLLHQSSILLVLTCKSTPSGAHGIMGTKFYEALGVEKPVLCVRSDEECLAQVIEQTHAGLAGTNVEQVAAFIEDKFHEWQAKGFTRQTTQHRELFTRRYQCQQIESIIKSHI